MQKFKKKKIYTKLRGEGIKCIRIPEICLEGLWLRKLGFFEGSHVIVEMEMNKLTIRVAEEQIPPVNSQ